MIVLDEDTHFTQDDARRLLALVRSVPEWMIFGNWDSPRCVWCKGFQHREPAGHKRDCQRQRVLSKIGQQQELPGLEKI